MVWVGEQAGRLLAYSLQLFVNSHHQLSATRRVARPRFLAHHLTPRALDHLWGGQQGEGRVINQPERRRREKRMQDGPLHLDRVRPVREELCTQTESPTRRGGAAECRGEFQGPRRMGRVGEEFCPPLLGPMSASRLIVPGCSIAGERRPRRCSAKSPLSLLGLGLFLFPPYSLDTLFQRLLWILSVLPELPSLPYPGRHRTEKHFSHLLCGEFLDLCFAASPLPHEDLREYYLPQFC